MPLPPASTQTAALPSCSYGLSPNELLLRQFQCRGIVQRHSPPAVCSVEKIPLESGTLFRQTTATVRLPPDYGDHVGAMIETYAQPVSETALGPGRVYLSGSAGALRKAA